MLNAKIEWNYKGKVGEQVLSEATEQLNLKLGNLSGFLEKVVRDILPLEVHQQFLSEGAYGTQPWAELAPATIKARMGMAHPILRRTGELERSFTPGEAGHIEQVEPLRAEFGSEVKYALFHQTGTGEGFDNPYEGRLGGGGHLEGHQLGRRTGRGHSMPQRQIIFWSERAKILIEQALKETVAKKAAEAGFVPAEQLELGF